MGCRKCKKGLLIKDRDIEKSIEELRADVEKVLEENLHININVLPRRMPALVDNSLAILKHLCTIFIGVVLVYYGIYLVKFQNQFGVVLPATQWPSSMQYIIMPAAGALIIVISILNILKMPRDVKYIDRIIGLSDEG